MENSKVQVLAMVWYREADFDQLMAMFIDRAKLHRTFLQWQDSAEQGRKRLLRQGHVVVKAHIDPGTFPAWCAAHGHQLDANGRNAFANAEAYRVATEMQSNTGR